MNLSTKQSARWVLRVTDPSSASAFAAEEFARLMKKTDPQSEVLRAAGNVPEDECLRIGVHPGCAGQSGEDGICIRVSECAGVIEGENPVSVLIALYRFFTECGCGFLRPGRDGEYIPQKDSAAFSVDVCEEASYRHRGICIEGSVSYENVADIIDWMPKVGMNTYFTQFFTPYTFFDRWYRHESNPYLTPAPLSRETVDCFMADYSAELKKRGMLHHGVGHGWTAEVLGLPGTGWREEADDSIPAGNEMFAAEVGGKRRLWNRVALNTNLCYSNPEVKRRIVEKVLGYASSHPEMDYIHFWLADDANNHCECEACRKARPADFYVDILNAMDEALTAAGLPTKIVFLVYNELWWAPETAKIQNPDRFTLMFAPIARTYSQAMNKDAKGCLAPYVRNKITAPRSTGDALESLRGWQEMFRGDSFVFDYHYMWDHCKDPGYYRMAQILTEDAENLHGIGLNGYISCQTQRSFLPTGLGMYLLGGTLWRGKTDFESEAVKYFAMTFGEDAEACRQYLARLSELFDPPTLRGEKKITDHPERYAQIREHVEAFARVLEKHREEEDPCRARSWEILRYHAKICVALAEILALMAEEKRGEAKAKWRALRDMMRRNESRYQNVFDMPLFVAVWEYQIAQDLWGEVWYGE